MATYVLNTDSNRPNVAANACKAIMHADPTKRWRVTIEAVKKDRTGKQNRGLFGVIYPPLMEFMGLQGEVEKEALHHHFCCEFFGVRENQIGVRVPKRTTTRDEHGKRDVVDWQTFTSFVGYVQRQAAEYGVVLPDPDPLWREGK